MTVCIPQDAFEFLRELGQQEPRRGPEIKAWFDANRERYKGHVVQPFRALASEAERWLMAIDPAQSLTFSRIRTQSGFTDQLWAQFGGGHGGPQLFIRITPEYLDFGFSTFSATPWQRDLLRSALLETPRSFWRYLGPLAGELSFEPNSIPFEASVDVASTEDLVRWTRAPCPRVVRYVEPGDALLTNGRLGEVVAHTLLALHRLAAVIWETEERHPPGRGVFISYRRRDSADEASRLHERLTGRLGTEDVFYDSSSIAGGEVWEARLLKSLGQSRVVLVVIGDDWSGEQAGGRRIDQPDDVVRQEIEQAFELGREVLPVLVNGASMPTAATLPRSLRAITRTQAFPLREATWSSDADQLLSAIAKRLAA